MSNPVMPFYACEFSQQVGEQLFATAPRTDVWLVLEHNGTWGNKAFVESDIPLPVQQHINAALEVIPNSRLQLIKHIRDRNPKIAFYVAISRESDSRMYAFALDSYNDLMMLDIHGIASALPQFDLHLTNKRLFLVCTNGRRDKCCSKFGFPLYQAVAKAAGSDAWQTSHVGGHRFAANVVCLPHGLFYGRVSSGDAVAIVEDYRKDHLHYSLLRGRSCYDTSSQAAEYFLRLETHNHNLIGFRLLSIEIIGSTYTVKFQSLDDTTHIIKMAQEQSAFEVHMNSDDSSQEHVMQWQLISFESI
jgi:hypothetical protein